MSILEQNKKLIQSIYEIYTANGFITEDQIFDMMIVANISLHAIDVLTGELLDRGVIITSGSEEADEDGDNDRTRTDYNLIFAEAVSVSPGLLPIIEYIKDIKPPQNREWQVLIPQAQNGNEYAINRLFEMYLRNVIRIALGYQKNGQIDLDGAIQNGALGLLRSISQYDSSKNVKYNAYFGRWIQQSINREIGDHGRTIRLPIHLIEILNTINVVKNRLYEKLDHDPTASEIFKAINKEVDAINISEAKIYRILQLAQEPIPISTLTDEKDDTSDPENIVSRMLMKEQIEKALNTLTPREEKVLRLRFGLDDGKIRTLEEIGIKLAVTRERIRQIEVKALRKLRHPSRSQKLRDFY